MNTRDADRFADLWRRTNGKPTKAQLAEYIRAGGRGIEVFTPKRIVNAEKLAKAVAANPEIYKNAVDRCLPWVGGTNADLRASYLGLRGLLPTRPLPEIAVVVGANSSGGTAAPGIQVIGLEVICRISPTRADFEKWLRQIYAHETVHAFQAKVQDSVDAGLLGSAPQEGVPDYIATLVTGRVPDAKRDAWAREREAWIWQEFSKDAEIVRKGTTADGEWTEEAQAAFQRWFANVGKAPAGWPDELGYWIGMRIAEAYVASSADPHAAIEELINPEDPARILQKSGYGRRLAR